MECEVSSFKCGVWSVECKAEWLRLLCYRVCSVNCVVWGVKCEVKILRCLQGVKCKVPKCKAKDGECRV